MVEGDRRGVLDVTRGVSPSLHRNSNLAWAGLIHQPLIRNLTSRV